MQSNVCSAHLRIGEMEVELGEAAVEKNKMRMKLFYLIRWQAWCKNMSHDLYVGIYLVESTKSFGSFCLCQCFGP